MEILQQPLFKNQTLLSQVTTPGPVTSSTESTSERFGKMEAVVIQGEHVLAPAMEIIVILALIMTTGGLYLMIVHKTDT